MTVEFPRSLLREQSHSWNIVGMAQVPGQTTTNYAASVRSDGGGFWSCTMSDVSLSGHPGVRGRDRQKHSTLAWRAVRQYCAGGVRSIVVPRNDALFRPWPKGFAAGLSDGIPHSDGAMFDDGFGYEQSFVDITAAASPLRATYLDITIVSAGPLLGGESFSIEHPVVGWRIYEISTVDYVTDNLARIKFQPPLRQAVTAGARLEFDRPRCLMRLASTNAMDLSVVPWTFNRASVSFVEAPAIAAA